MQEHFINHNKSRYHYRQFGHGDQLLFCFHGYGRDSNTFGFLENKLGKKYTLVAIDAPYHGHTEFDETIFHPKDLVNVLRQINADSGKAAKKVALLGFSMGGRIALNVAQVFAADVDRVVLLAPDGLKFNFWQWFATHTWLGNKIFDYTVHHPAWLLKVIHFSEKRGLLSKNITGFIRYYMEDNEERFVLYRRWIIMRKFRPHLSSLKKNIHRYKITVRMLFGRYDRIIQTAGGQAFIKNIEPYAKVSVIEAGHDLLREWNAQTIATLFND